MLNTEDWVQQDHILRVSTRRPQLGSLRRARKSNPVKRKAEDYPGTSLSTKEMGKAILQLADGRDFTKTTIDWAACLETGLQVAI